MSLEILKHKCIMESKQGSVMAIPKSGPFYVAECLVVVKNPPAPETGIMIDKNVTFAVATGATNVWHHRFGYLGT